MAAIFAKVTLTNDNIKEFISYYKGVLNTLLLHPCPPMHAEVEEILAYLEIELSRRIAEWSLKYHKERMARLKAGEETMLFLSHDYRRAEAAHRHEICSYFATCDCTDCTD